MLVEAIPKIEELEEERIALVEELDACKQQVQEQSSLIEQLTAEHIKTE